MKITKVVFENNEIYFCDVCGEYVKHTSDSVSYLMELYHIEDFKSIYVCKECLENFQVAIKDIL